MDGRANPLMDQKVVGFLFESLQWLQWPPHRQLLDVLWCSAAVVVIVLCWSCSRGFVRVVSVVADDSW